jgi:hypothetical protein
MEGGAGDAELADLLDRWWIQHSMACHAASVVFARKPNLNGTRHICCYYWGLITISWPTVELLQHIDALLDGTLGSCFFTKLDLASSYHKLQRRALGLWNTSFLLQLGQFE